MTAPVRPVQADPVAAYLAKYGAPGQSPTARPAASQSPAPSAPAGVDPVQHYLDTYKPDTTPPGLGARTWALIKGSVPTSFSEAGQDVANLATGTVNALGTSIKLGTEDPWQAGVDIAVDPKGSASALAQGASLALGGPISGKVESVLAPTAGRILARAVGTALSGATVGAAFNPDDPAAGALAGAALAPAGEVAGRTAGRALSGVRNVASSVLDASGRPAVSTPLVQSAADRAATLNAAKIAADQTTPRVGNSAPATAPAPSTGTIAGPSGAPLATPTVPVTPMASTPFNDASLAASGAAAKPVTPMDLGGTGAVRAARDLKTQSPAAEQVLRDALQPRDDEAVQRVIEHGLEATGLQTRDSGVQLVGDLIQQRSDEADAAWPQMFANNPQAISDPRIAKVWGTDSGQRAWREVPGLMSDRFLPVPPAPGAFDPSTMAPDKAAMYSKLVDMNGGNTGAADAAMRALGETPTPAPTTDGPPPMNLQQLHFWAKALDDLSDRGPGQPGQPGNGYNKAQGAGNLAGTVRAIAKDNVPEYADLSQKYASASDLVKGAQLGQQLFKMHPDEAAQAMQQLPSDAQDVFRRAGFDALAERIENGPQDVERGVAKSRDQKRMRLLFPDEDSFDQFKQGLVQEGRLYANNQAVFGGSNTADKFADMANMAGVTIPDVARAIATGRIHRLVGKAAAGIARKVTSGNTDALAIERARLLTAGANGDVAARTSALSRMGLDASGRPVTAPPAPSDQFTIDLARSLGAAQAGTRGLITRGPFAQPNGGQ